MLYLDQIRGVMTELDPNLAIVVATVALPASIIGIIIGAFTFSFVSDDGIRIIIGIIAYSLS